MNKLLLLSAAIFASINVYGQGEINFGNNASTYVSNSITGDRIVKGNTFTAQLWYAPDSAVAPTDAGMQPLGATTGISPLAGLITGGKRVVPGTPGPNGTGGGAAWFQIRTWETAYGTTWEEATTKTLNGRLAVAGKSNIFKTLTGDPGANPPGTPGSLVGTAANPLLRSFSVEQIVPEPSIIGLGLLGAGAFLFLRRRR
jgi:hypothetical protein